MFFTGLTVKYTDKATTSQEEIKSTPIRLVSTTLNFETTANPLFAWISQNVAEYPLSHLFELRGEFQYQTRSGNLQMKTNIP